MYRYKTLISAQRLNWMNLRIFKIFTDSRLFQIFTGLRTFNACLISGANPTTSSYNASVVKNYNAMNSLVHI
jgi:hypothetical protein